MSQNNKIEEKVMADIKSGKVKLRSRYIFLAEKMGLSGVFVFSALLAVLFFTLTLFYLKTSDNLGYLSFGHRGLFAFLETFPYLLVASVVVFVFLAGFILKKSEFAYRESFSRLSLALVGFIVIAGLVLTFTSLGERIEKRGYDHQAPDRFFRPFLRQEFIERERGVVGKIIEAGFGYIEVETPFGIKKVDLKEIPTSTVEQLETAVFIMAIGEQQGDVFVAKNLRIVEEGKMPMIRRGVDERTGSFEKRIPLPAGDRINCPGDCLMK